MNTGITVTGANPGSYTETNTCPAMLAGGSKCTISIIFTPQALGALSASISVTDNAAGSPQTVALTGTGVAPAVTVAPTSIAFGNQAIGTTAAVKTVTITNSGTGPLHIDGVSVIQATNGIFFEVDSCAALSPLAVGASCTLNVQFAPKLAQNYTATISIVDDASNSPQSIALTGTGVTVKPILSITPLPLNFGSVAVGTTSPAMQLMLSNSGTTAFDFSSYNLTNGSFNLSQTGTDCSVSLAPGTTCTYAFTFSPTATGVVSSTFTVTDSINSVTGSATITGTGATATIPIAALSPTTLNFGNQAENTSSGAQIVTLSNTGTASLTGIVVTLQEQTSAGAFRRVHVLASGITSTANYSATTTCQPTLAANTNCSISVVFDPASIGSLPGTLSVADDASNSPQTVALAGIGTVPPAPVAVLTPTTLTFGNQVAGTSSNTQTVTLSNTGNAPLMVTSITVNGTNAADFTETTTCGNSVPMGASCPITVTFTPASAASFTAMLSVADNAAGTPQTVALSGTGVPPPDFTIAATPAIQSVQNGSAANYTVTTTAVNGDFAGAIALSVSGLPTGARATFTPASISPGSTSATSTLTVQTSGTQSAQRQNKNGSNSWPLAVPALGLLLLPLRRKWRSRMIPMLLLGFTLLGTLGASLALSGCGGGFALPQTSQTYTLTVTGTGGADAHSTTVQLTVQNAQ